MKVTRLTQPELLQTKLEAALAPLGIILYDVSFPTRSSFKFRAKRSFNKLYCAGGLKFGVPVGNAFSGYHGPLRQAAHLHWEEWACINDLINDICNRYDLKGTFKSYFDGDYQFVRKNGIRTWISEITDDQIDNMLLEAQNSLSKAS